MANLFYLYGIVEIISIIYYLNNYLKDNNHDTVTIDITDTPEVIKEATKFGFIMSSIGFIWGVTGLFTKFGFCFLILLATTLSFGLYKNKLSEKGARNVFVFNSILRLSIIVFIMYKHFYN